MPYHKMRLLAQVGWLSFLNAIRYDRHVRRRWVGQLIGLGTLVVVISLATAFVFKLASREFGAEFQRIVFQALVFFTFVGLLMVVRDTMDLIMRRAYQAPDIPLLMSSPLSPAQVFLHKLMQIATANLPSLCVWLLPPWLVMGILSHAHWEFYTVLPLVLLLLLICTIGGVGISLLLVMRYLISSRVLRVLRIIIMGCGFLVGLSIAMFFVVQDSQKEEFFRSVIAAMSHAPQARPDYWATQVLVSFMPGIDASWWPAAGYLLASSVLLMASAILLAGRIYHQGWELSHTIQNRQNIADDIQAGTNSKTPQWADRWRGRTSAIMLKDLRALRHNPQYIMMSLLLTGIAVVTIFLVALQSRTGNSADLFSNHFPPLFFQVVLYSAIVTLPLTIHAFRGESETWWLLQSTPITTRVLFRAKQQLAVAVTCLYVGCCVCLGMLLLHIPLIYWIPALALVGLIVASMASVNVAAGTLQCFAELGKRGRPSPLTRVSTTFVILLVNVLLLAIPFVAIAIVWTEGGDMPILRQLPIGIGRAAILTIVTGLLLALIKGVQRLGERSLGRLLTP